MARPRSSGSETDKSPPEASTKPIKFQRDFIARTAGVGDFLQLLDAVPDGLFFLKDEMSRFVWVSKTIRERFGLNEGWEVAGKTDYDFHDKHLADNFLRDDRVVLQTDQPLIARVEIWFNSRRQLDWVVTSKFPVHDVSGRVTGILGIILNSASGQTQATANTPVGLVLNYIQANYNRLVRVEELAGAAHLSPRQLLRMVRREFGLSVHQLVMKTRIQAAADALLRKKTTIGGVATDFGFCDQSAFTREFRKYLGQTPSAFLAKYGHGENSGDAE